jgi:RIO kinase 1
MRDSAHFDDYGVTRRGKKRGRFDEDEPAFAKRDRHRKRLQSLDSFDATDGLPAGDRWSTWDQSTPTEQGPLPHPDWLVTELAATDSELGIIKTGKEADVFLLRRGVPDTSRACLLAAKRYRSGEHRLFHRDSAYLEGRRVRESRDNRAMANRTAVGLQMIAVQWANAEFSALSEFYGAGVPVPYPVQVLGTEVLLEFIGEPDGTAALRLADTGLRGSELASLWQQLVESMVALARLGFAHGDLSAYNLLVHREKLIMIDLPQVVDVIANPRGGEFLDRDAGNVGRWFAAHGLAAVAAGTPDPEHLAAVLREEARLG